MSHFTVLVIGENPEEKLAPYHEYECTGNDDKYVVDVDCTDEVEKRLNEEVYVGENEKGVLDHQYKHAKDKLKNPKKTTFRGYYKLAGLSEDNEIKDYFGYHKKGGKRYNHTNPNAKRDWYLLGGRWAGMFTAKPGVDISEYETGTPSLVGMATGQKVDRSKFDQIRKGDIDFEAMEKEETERIIKQYKPLYDYYNNNIPVPKHKREDLDKTDIDKARNIYGGQEEVKGFERMKHDKNIFSLENLEDFEGYKTVEDYAKAKYEGFYTFAVIKDGKWYEKGEMGWRGCVANDKGADNRCKEFQKLIQDLSDDTLLSVYDCHI